MGLSTDYESDVLQTSPLSTCKKASEMTSTVEKLMYTLLAHEFALNIKLISLLF